MSQFDRIKKQYQDYILLFQVGDFYEIYGDDASKYRNHDIAFLFYCANHYSNWVVSVKHLLIMLVLIAT